MTNLITANPSEGQRLATQLAHDLLAALPAGDTSMQAMLRTASKPDPIVATAIYFHAISLANDGWRN